MTTADNIKLLLIQAQQYCEQHKFEQAKDIYVGILRMFPDCIAAYIDFGGMLDVTNNALFAGKIFEAGLEKEPNNHLLLAGLSKCYVDVDVEKAYEYVYKSIKFEPLGIGQCYLGYIHYKCGRYQESKDAFDKFMQQQPEHKESKVGVAFTQLMMGDYSAEAWNNYEYRLLVNTKRVRHKDKPTWDGKIDLRDKTILIWTEQGLGDTIQFCRLLKKLAQEYKPKCIIFEVQPALARLYQGFACADKVIERDQLTQPVDYVCSLVSLPALIGWNVTQAKVSKHDQCLLTKPARQNNVPAMLQTDKPKIALVWNVNNTAYLTKQRNIDFQYIHQIIKALPHVNFYAMQKNNARSDLLHISESNCFDLGSYVNDFYDSASMLQEIDMVVTVDTAMAHLAGAMNKKAIVLIPQQHDWRWSLLNVADDHDNIWYDSLHLIRQQAQGEWQQAIEQVIASLLKLYPKPSSQDSSNQDSSNQDSSNQDSSNQDSSNQVDKISRGG